MHCRCPHCHNPIEIVADDPLIDVECPSCGSHFRFVAGQATTPYRPGERKFIGHFELIKQVGTGQFGTVWRARDTEFDRTVAVTIPRKDELSNAEMEPFLREARAAAQVEHPGIVSVHEIGRTDDSVYIVSEFVQGANLSEWLSSRRISLKEAAELCVALAKEVGVAHEAGIVHRDLKPGNIVMDLDGKPHITDFGLAKRESGEITLTLDGRVQGTPAYMPPELARGEAHEADRRTDVYSLGVILYQLITGELPFRGETRMLIVQILRDEPTPPRKLNSRVPRDLETICLKCLEKDRDHRYASARALADDLERFLLGKAISARPIRHIERGWRWCRRKPVVGSLAAGLLLALTTGLIVAMLLWIVTARNEQD